MSMHDDEAFVPPKSQGLLDDLMNALRILPGVGPRSAMRMAYQLLYKKKEQGKYLAHTLLKSLESIHHCQSCNTLSETPICQICSNPNRDKTILCIVEMPIDVHMLEQSQSYKGKYFVLMGKLSPLDGVGPKDIAFDDFLTKVMKEQIEECIIATNFTTEGETTAFYLARALCQLEKTHQRSIKITRLARGVPSGSELEYVDAHTIARALADRRTLS